MPTMTPTTRSLDSEVRPGSKIARTSDGAILLENSRRPASFTMKSVGRKLVPPFNPNRPNRPRF